VSVSVDDWWSTSPIVEPCTGVPSCISSWLASLSMEPSSSTVARAVDLAFIRKNAFIILIVLVVVVVPSVFAYNYIQNDPKFCTTCHLMNTAFSTWNSSAKHSLNCHTCHESDMLTNVDHLGSVVAEGKSVVTKASGH
jgi:hypothetical protein